MNAERTPSLNRLMFRLLLLWLLLPLLLLTVLFFGLTGYLGGRQAGVMQNELAFSVSQTAGFYLEDAVRIVKALAVLAETSGPEELARSMEAMRQSYGRYDTFSLLDSRRRIVVSAPPNHRYQRLDMSYQPYIDQARDKAGIAVSQPKLSVKTSHPAVFITRLLFLQRSRPSFWFWASETGSTGGLSNR